MKKVYFLFVLAGYLFLSNSSLHPAGNTGAPGDSFCGNCHSGGGSLDGNITIEGWPSTIQPNTTYPITVKVTNPSMNANRAGFQILVLNQNNMNAGTFSNIPSNTQLRTQSGRTYLGHSPATPFAGSNELIWQTDWTSPATGSQITIYGAGVIANGAGGNSGDRAVITNVSGTMMSTSPLSVNVNLISNVSCNSGSNGSAVANATGGNTPYTYAWDNGESTATAIALTAGNHTVTVTDGSSMSQTGSIFISEPANPLSSSTVNIAEPSCFNTNDGSISLQIQGGTPSYQTSWSNGSSGPTINNLSGGLYQYTITDANGCTLTDNIILGTPDPIETSTNINNVSCNGGSNGSIILNGFGGVGTLAYEWANGSTGPIITNLSAGTYEVTITDDNSCSEIFLFAVSEPQALSSNVSNVNPASCATSANGTATVTVTGGSSPYTALWSDGGTGLSRNDLAANTYEIVVTDNNGCQTNISVTIGAAPPINISLVSSNNASCLGVEDGSITVSASGGSNPNFSYEWPNGTNGPTITGITAGNYIVTVTDLLGCTNTASFTVGANNAASLSTSTITNTSCYGSMDGAASISISNGSGYAINWSNGATGSSISGVTAGIYLVQAFDNAGCESNELAIEILQPDSISIQGQVSDPLCAGDTNGSISASASGGTGDIAFTWSNGAITSMIGQLSAGIYTIIATDSNNCTQSAVFNLTDPIPVLVTDIIVNSPSCADATDGSISVTAQGGIGILEYEWSNGDTTSAITGLGAGTFNLNVTDANGCSLDTTVVLTEPSALNTDFDIINETVPNANDGQVTSIPMGGTPPYTYDWSTGDTTQQITNLGPGRYFLTLTDANGCSFTKSVNVGSGDCLLNVEASIQNVLCNGQNTGSIAIAVANDIGGYTILLNGDSVSNLENLTAGTYTVEVIDSAGCSFEVKNLQITEPSPINVIIDNVTNTFTDTGSISISVEGGTAPYTYSWLNTLGQEVSTDQNPTGLVPDFYVGQVTDANGCVFITDSIVITQLTSTSETAFEVKVYPNPTRQSINIISDAPVQKVEVYQLDGRLLMSEKVSTNQLSIDISHLNSAMYQIKVTTSLGISTEIINKM